MKLPDGTVVIYIGGNSETLEQLKKTAPEDVTFCRAASFDDFVRSRELFNESPAYFLLEDRGPEGAGWGEIIRRIRLHERNALIIMLLDTQDTERRTKVYRDGADGYICRPFEPEEVLYCISAMLQRKEEKGTGEWVCLAHAEVNINTAQVIREDRISHLTGKEYRIFMMLLKNTGRIVSVSDLCTALSGKEWEGYERTLMTHIYHLREKIEKNPSVPVSLITVKGLGYRLDIVDFK